MEYLGMLIGRCLELMKHEITVFGFTVSYWNLFMFSILASIFARIFRAFFIDG